MKWYSLLFALLLSGLLVFGAIGCTEEEDPAGPEQPAPEDPGYG